MREGSTILFRPVDGVVCSRRRIALTKFVEDILFVIFILKPQILSYPESESLPWTVEEFHKYD